MQLQTYHILSKIKFLKKYSFKFLFVAFLGIHIPLIGLIFFILFADITNISPWTILILVLLMTLIATGITLWILNSLLKPILITKEFLSEYINNNKILELPINYNDEVGILMKEIKYSISTLDELIKEKQDLIGLMSHDLKNPITAVMNYSELLSTDAKFSPIGEKIKEASNTQKDIINSVLQMLEQGSILVTEEMKSKENINELFEVVISLFENQLKEKNISIINNLNVLNNQNIFVNRNLFLQVLTNIVGNSVKFTENGQISLNFLIEDKFAKIQVIDNGIGFDQNISNNLFDRFTKYKRKGTNNEATTGLGLYLCKKIIDKHQGSIEAFSEGKGLGSKFTITIPA